MISLLLCAGLVKKNPNAGGSAVPDPNAKHNPFCYFNVTWTVVAPGTIPTAADAATPAATSAATSSATSAADNGDLPSTDTTPEGELRQQTFERYLQHFIFEKRINLGIDSRPCHVCWYEHAAETWFCRQHQLVSSQHQLVSKGWRDLCYFFSRDGLH